MHDLVIRNGKIVDGSGKPAFTSDIAVDAGSITAVGDKAGAGKREIDAAGLLVTPGWVDIHTHYDGQVAWDPVPQPFQLAWRNDHCDGQLRRWFCACRPGNRTFSSA